MLGHCWGTKTIPIASPFASLSAAVSESDSFRCFVKQQILRHPPSPEQPWSIILYSDEVTPGNPLTILNKRRFQSIYWSFKEFDTTALSHEDTWFVLLTEYSTCINAFPGGLSQVFAAAIHSFFMPDGLHMMDSGIGLDIDGRSFRIFAKLGVVLQDGGAHKAVWQARGDGASRFCVLCKNIFTHESNVVLEDGTRLLRSNQIRLDDLEASSDTELRNNARYLERMSTTLTHGQFTQLQQAMGLTYAPHGILLDRRLDRVLQPTSV